MLSSRILSGLTRVRPTISSIRTMAATADGYSYETLEVSSPRENVYHVQLNRPKKLNAMNNTMWTEVGQCFQKLGEDSDCRAIVLSGSGKIFTSGLDLSDMTGIVSVVMGEEDVARKCRTLHRLVQDFQSSFTALEKCPKPVIAAIHNACVGGGVDLITAADIRYCTNDAWFQVKEVELGLAADVGTLQRLPKVIGNQSLARELAFSARKVFSNEALQCGLVSRMFNDYESLINGAIDMATTIAEMSPVAVQNTKTTLIYSRDHSVQEGLDYMANMNMSMLQSEDVRISAMAMMSKEKKKPQFAKL